MVKGDGAREWIYATTRAVNSSPCCARGGQVYLCVAKTKPKTTRAGQSHTPPGAAGNEVPQS